ncbi:MAG: hypothetical protein R2697_09655 [Ilumatobacteraceae bacterium]
MATEFTPDGIVDGSEIAVTFEDGAVIVMAGCNTQRGGYSIADGVPERRPDDEHDDGVRRGADGARTRRWRPSSRRHRASCSTATS